ncbi:unnamed protein product [Cercospora beticola]|nr:unnamed protein product [Cercospora beticola]
MSTPEDEVLLHCKERTEPNPRKSRRSRVTKLILLAITHSAIAFFAMGVSLSTHCTAQNCDEQVTSRWMSTIDRRPRTMQFNGFGPFNAFTRKAGSSHDADVQQRWIDLGTYSRPMLLPLRYAADFQLEASMHVVARPETYPGTSEAGFPVTLEMFHQLHCVDYLRQGLFYNVAYYRNEVHSLPWLEANDTDAVETHLAHCVDALRQLILCHADIGVAPFKLGEQTPDFGRPRTCRNWVSVRKFGVENEWNGMDPIRVDNLHLSGSLDRRVLTFSDTESLWKGL